MNHEVKKGPGYDAGDDEAFDQGRRAKVGRGGDHLSPTEPIKATTRTEWQWGDSFHAAPAHAEAPNPRDSRHLLGPTRRQGRRERGDRQTDSLTEQTILGGEIPMVRRRELS